MKEYVYFSLIEKKPKTNVYEVLSINNHLMLGKVYWYPQWRQYIFEPFGETVWSAGCLNQIKEFLDKLMRERKT